MRTLIKQIERHQLKRLDDSEDKKQTATSKNIVRKITFEDGEEKKTYYAKENPTAECSKLEAVITTTSPYIGPEDVLILKDEDDNIYVATREIHATSIHDIFEDEEQTKIFTTEISNPKPITIESFAKILIHILMTGNDDAHASNLFYDFNKHIFRIIDFDSTILIKKLKFKEERLLNFSQDGWQEISPFLIDSLISISCPWPHYHPLHELSVFQKPITTDKNLFSKDAHRKLHELTEHPKFNNILITELIKTACLGYYLTDEICSAIGLTEELAKQTMDFFTEQQTKLINACRESALIKELLESPKEMLLIRNKLFEVERDDSFTRNFKLIYSDSIISIQQQILFYQINKLIELIQSTNPTLSQEFLTHLGNLYHLIKINSPLKEITDKIREILEVNYETTQTATSLASSILTLFSAVDFKSQADKIFNETLTQLNYLNNSVIFDFKKLHKEISYNSEIWLCQNCRAGGEGFLWLAYAGGDDDDDTDQPPLGASVIYVEKQTKNDGANIDPNAKLTEEELAEFKKRLKEALQEDDEAPLATSSASLA